MRVALVRTGSVWWIDTKGASAVGEQNDATGIARYLLDQGHDVCIYARHKGHLDGCHHIQWDGIEKDDPQYDHLVEQLKEWAPDVIVEISGASPTMSMKNNHKGVTVFDFSILYYACALYTYHKMKMPRLVILNDPRSYPKDQEMTVWPEVRPAAILSQFPQEKKQRVDGRYYDVKAIYAGCENWWSWAWPYAEIDNGRKGCTIIAHSHMNDSRLLKNRENVWAWILQDVDFDYKVFGKGWEHYDGYDPKIHRGPVHPDMVHTLLQKAECGPMIPITEGWLTAKMRQYLVNGALPLLYGRGQGVALKYDRDCRVVPDDSVIRFSDSAELNAAVRIENKAELVEHFRKLTEPNFELLDAMIEHFAAGGQRCEKFGGYFGGV